MFPSDWSCHGCGKVLNADGNHPAELYAGTHTGLCYTCERSEGFVASVDDLDGVRTWSYPPASPSWRRDRETFTAYADCPDCGGAGFTWDHRYRSSCRTCSARRASHPLRQWHSGRLEALRHRAEAVYAAELVAATGLPERTSKKAMAEATLAVHNSPEGEALAAGVLARYRRIQDRFEALAAARFEDAATRWNERQGNPPIGHRDR